MTLSATVPRSVIRCTSPHSGDTQSRPARSLTMCDASGFDPRVGIVCTRAMFERTVNSPRPSVPITRTPSPVNASEIGAAVDERTRSTSVVTSPSPPARTRNSVRPEATQITSAESFGLDAITRTVPSMPATRRHSPLVRIDRPVRPPLQNRPRRSTYMGRPNSDAEPTRVACCRRRPPAVVSSVTPSTVAYQTACFAR